MLEMSSSRAPAPSSEGGDLAKGKYDQRSQDEDAKAIVDRITLPGRSSRTMWPKVPTSELAYSPTNEILITVNCAPNEEGVRSIFRLW